MPQVRQAAFRIALLTLEIGQPVPVQSILIALRLHLPPILRVVVLFISVHADRRHSLDQRHRNQSRTRLPRVGFGLLVIFKVPCTGNDYFVHSAPPMISSRVTDWPGWMDGNIAGQREIEENTLSLFP